VVKFFWSHNSNQSSIYLPLLAVRTSNQKSLKRNTNKIWLK